ncbi:hypothetical protein VTI74DRAFT_10759 [Chaetomium olivicolor]
MSASENSTQQWRQSPGRDSPGGAQAEPTGLACNPCRKRKLRCSRELPACQHCRKTGAECVYEAKRNKPGLKSGALENVHRRLDALERTVQRLDDGAHHVRKAPSGGDGDRERNACGILALLARELPKFLEGSTSSPNKRRRTDGESVSGASNGAEELEDEASSPGLPPQSALNAILDAYFTCIHPWIPMIHQSRFRRRLADPLERPKLDVVLHAIVLTASRFVSDQQHIGVPTPDRRRSWVVSTAMDCMSVESLQAMIILAFNDIGSGLASKAWSLVGSMTRTVEYLQLSVEHNETKRHPLSQPFQSLAPTNDWTENEERRRVFWNVFLLDRFCSVAMGWNTSLTSDDVHRRLPCDGILWRKQDPVTTPFFGIWDKAAARIGNPISFLPSESSGTISAAADAENPTVESSSPRGALGTDMTNVGAYAYCIEATESLSRVTSHFLQQRIDWRDGRDVGLWLMRFKELDLRLVHWKMLLPHKWKADSYRVGSTPLVMDPNLTLAHVTHNASMILLHQPIAFPPAGFAAFKNRLPSACSVETCLAAATEIAVITTKYLESTARGLPLAHQYAFCIYIAARVLLVNWRYGYAETELPREFWTLVYALDEFSARWSGRGGSIMASDPSSAWDLAAKYARKLRELHARCLQNGGFSVDVAAYTAEIDHSTTAGTDHQASHHLTDGYQAQPAPPQGAAVSWAGMYGSSELPFPMAERHRGGAFSPSSSTTGGSGAMLSRRGTEILNLGTENHLGSISQTLLDQQFGEMDRIISFEDGTMFAAAIDGAGGW